ncbi:MAG: SIS domain-containing protein [Anaerolineae bacterium]|nr:SIS domain-containing protein [Anaerolineae bacterium]
MFQDRIRGNYESLTPGFRKLADFIMNNTLDAAFLTATELSRRVGVDPATVVRFAQELEYSGYRELSREIKHYVRDQVTSTYRKASEASSTEALLRALVDNASQNMQSFVTTDLPNVVKAVEILKMAPHIWFIGEFTGHDIAAFIAKKFQSYGLSSSTFHPSIAETASAVARMKKDEVLLAFAGTEPSLDTGYAVRLAREKGVKTITVTGSGVTLPAREAELTIIVPCKTPVGVPTFGTLMQVMGLIWEAIMRGREEVTTKAFQETQVNMEQILKLRAETAEYEVAAPQKLWGENLIQ